MDTDENPMKSPEPSDCVPDCVAHSAKHSASWHSKTLRVSVALALFLGLGGLAEAQVGFRFGVPGLSIGINIPVYPTLVEVPGYPVYYAPDLDTNLFFYDGLYWVYEDDRWYASEWYNGPWELVEPESVPYFILRVPVQYYRRPPPFFLGWNRLAPPRWDERWGRGWEQRHHDWNQWDRRTSPPRAPLPDYQRAFPRDRYPSRDQQQSLRDRDYHFRPRQSEDRRLWSSPPAPTRDSSRRPPESQHPTVPQPEPRAHIAPSSSEHRPGAEQQRAASPADQPVSGDRRRVPPPPNRREATGISGSPPHPGATQPHNGDFPGARRNDGDRSPPRTDQRGTTDARPAPPDRQGPQRVNPGVRPQPPQQSGPSRREKPPN